MANQDQIDAMMRNFPPEAELLQMAPEDLGMHLLKYMTSRRGPGGSLSPGRPPRRLRTGQKIRHRIYESEHLVPEALHWASGVRGRGIIPVWQHP